MKAIPRLLVLAACSALSSPQAQAASLGDWLRVDVFGTVSAYQGDDPVAGVRPDQRSSQFSRDKDWRFDGDSLVSSQLTFNPNGKVRGVLQVLAKDDAIERFKPQTEWAYVSWDTTSDLNLKVGRVVAPVFLMSETRNLAYAQTSVRPTQTVYQLITITNIDGLSVNWSQALAGGTLNLEAAAGKSSVGLTIGNIEVNSSQFFAAKWQGHGLTARLGYAAFKFDANFPGTQAAVARLSSGATDCTNCASVLSARVPFKIKSNILTLAGGYEIGNLSLQAEWAKRSTTSAAVADGKGWYAQAAYRLGDWTPYVSFGEVTFHESAFGLQTAAAAPAASRVTNEGFDLFLQGRNDRKQQQVGVRWDFRENFALKLAYETFKLTRPPFLGVNGVVSYPTSPPIGGYTGPAPDGKVNMISINLDFVF